MSNTGVVSARAVFIGLAQALATLVVCAIAMGTLLQLQKWESVANGYFDQIVFLLLFMTSALASATLVLAYPAYLLLKQRLREGFTLLISTVLWLILLLAGLMTAVFLV
jgi:hypothetical protein